MQFLEEGINRRQYHEAQAAVNSHIAQNVKPAAKTVFAANSNTTTATQDTNSTASAHTTVKHTSPVTQRLQPDDCSFAALVDVAMQCLDADGDIPSNSHRQPALQSNVPLFQQVIRQTTAASRKRPAADADGKAAKRQRAGTAAGAQRQ